MGTSVATHMDSHTHTKKKKKKTTSLSQQSQPQNRGRISSYGVTPSRLFIFFSLSLSLSLSLHHSLPLPFSPPPFLRPSLTNTFIMTWHLYNNLLFSLQRSSTPEIWSVGFMLRSFHSFCQSDNFFFFFWLESFWQRKLDVFTSQPSQGRVSQRENNTKEHLCTVQQRRREHCVLIVKLKTHPWHLNWAANGCRTRLFMLQPMRSYLLPAPVCFSEAK